jgi:hypothetical protein
MRNCLRVGLLLGLLAPLCIGAQTVQAPKPSRKQVEALRRAKTFCVQKAQEKAAEKYLEWAERILNCTALRVEQNPGAGCDVVVTAEVREVYFSANYSRPGAPRMPGGVPMGGVSTLESGGEVKGSLVMAMKGAPPLELKIQGREAPAGMVMGPGGQGQDRDVTSNMLFYRSGFTSVLLTLAADIWGPDVLISARRWIGTRSDDVEPLAKIRGPAIQDRLLELASMESKDLEPIKKESVADAFWTIDQIPRFCRDKFLLEALRRGVAAGRTSPVALGLLDPGVQVLKTPQDWLAWGDKQSFPDCANAILP